MRKIFTLLAAVFIANHAFADSLTDGIGSAGDAIYSYTPYVQALGYVLACLIGIIGAFAVYYAYVNEAHDIKKRILRWSGGCVAMLCMTIALPKFFSYQETGLLAGNNSSSNIGTGQFSGGDHWGVLDPSIPDLNDSRWQADERFWRRMH